MGQQQILLLVLGVIIVGTAIAVGVTLFGADSTLANKDGVTSGLMNIAANAYQYKIRPSTLGGGSQRYLSYTIPSKMAADENGAYTLTSVASNSVVIRGASSINPAWYASCTVDDTGKFRFVYNGW